MQHFVIHHQKRRDLLFVHHNNANGAMSVTANRISLKTTVFLSSPVPSRDTDVYFISSDSFQALKSYTVTYSSKKYQLGWIHGTGMCVIGIPYF